MSGKDSSIVSKEALMGTKPGKQIIKQGLFKSKGYRMFSKYKLEAEIELPKLAERFAKQMHAAIKNDNSPADTLKAFVAETGEPEMDLQPSMIEKVKANLNDPEILQDRIKLWQLYSASSLYLENMRYPLDLKSPCLIICLPGLVPMRASLLTIEESLPLICKQGMFCY